MSQSAIKNIYKLGFPWETEDPFLFSVHHEDFYPRGNENLGPTTSLEGRRMGNDFTVKDGFRMYHGQTVPGFPAHPHRGFETVTVVRKGLVDHADSAGGAGRYGNGDVQWMTAGKGLQHSEMFPLLNQDKENPFELFQIWINLPAANKFVEPTFKMIWSEQQAKEEFIDSNGNKTKIEVVAGRINKNTPPPPPNSWAQNPDNHVAIWNIKIEANGEFKLPKAVAGLNRNLYFYKGDTLQIENEKIDVYKGIKLDSNQDVVIQNGNTAAHLVLLQGKPIGEPVVRYGPFVMNSNEEVEQAMKDYQNTQFGGWPWERTDKNHGPTKGRFAKHIDGELEEKN